MKKVFISLILLLLINSNVYAIDNLKCDSSILVDGDTGQVLFESNSNAKKYPASLTKLMTAVVALELGDLEDILTVDDVTPFTIDGSHIALEPGEKLSLENLLNALLIASANDAAEVIAKSYAGSIDAFAEKMNEKAKAIGMNDTNFTNPHGLHDQNHYSTASDLSKLAVYAYKNDTIRNIVNKLNYTIPTTNIKNEVRQINTSNRLLTGTGYGNQILVSGRYVDIKYNGATGMKTGYTPQAGSCLIGSSERNGLTLISVVLDGYITDVYSDTVALLNHGFDDYVKIELSNKNVFYDNLIIEGANVTEIPLISNSNLYSIVKKGEETNLEKKLVIENTNLPIQKNSVIGKLEFYIDNKIIGSVGLITPIEIKAFTPFNTMNKINIIIITVISVFLFFFVLILFLRIFNKLRLNYLRKLKKMKTGN